ncbi:MAG: type II toxin-antitoxin system HicB family antitoxin [Candidatus Omnitrophica bacterium]|nr:type II toxin-antitoxin system HicB family antitoxin [Candidatus Omnitrophota bacterium]
MNIVWSDEDAGFIATVPELKNLSAFGVTYEEALREAQEAIEGYIETLNDEESVIPAPVTLASYSGQTRIRMPRQLHQLLSLQAEREGTSLNAFMVMLLSLNFGLTRKREQSKEIIVYYISNNEKSEFYNSQSFLGEGADLRGISQSKIFNRGDFND